MANARGKKKSASAAVADTDGSEARFDAAVATVRGTPEDVAVWAALEELGAAAGRAADVAALYRELVGEPGVAALLGARAVEFHDEWGEEPAAIEELVRRVLVVTPGETWAFDRLKLTYSTEERWGDLLEVIDLGLAAARADDVRTALLDDAVKVAKDFARDFERAIGYAERLLAVRADERTRGILEKLYEKCERHESLVTLYRDQLPSLEVGAAQALRKKIAAKWLGLGDQDRAFAVIEEMLAIDAEDAGAFELLERIFGTPSRSIPPPSSRRSLPSLAADAPPGDPGRPNEPPRSTRQRAALLLKPKYLAEGRAQELVRVLGVELAVARNDEERALAYRELAALHLDTLRDDAGALAALSSLVVLEPDESLHRKALAQVAGRLGSHDRQAKVLVAAADRVVDPGTRAVLLTEAAEVCRGPLEAPGRAIDLYQRVAAIEELPVVDRLVALRELSGLLAGANRLAEKCEVLERLAVMETDPEARRAALGEVARIAQEDFGDADRSARAWQSRLVDDPADLEAIEGVRPVLRSQGRLRDLAGALERAAAAIRDRDASRIELLRSLLHEAATIAEEELHDAVAATRGFEALLVHAPDDEPVLERLAALYRQAGRRADLLSLRRRQLALAVEPTRVKDRLRLRLDIAAVHKELGEGDARIAALEENLRDDPRDEPTASELGDALATSARFGHLVSLWESQARAYEEAGDRVRATSLWRKAAGLAEERLADPRRAIEDHERAGDDPASLDALARLYESEGNLVASASALERLARLTTGDDRVAVQLRLASALVSAGRREAARRALEEAARETPDERLRSMLAEIYRADEAWESLAQHFVREAELADTDAERVDMLRAAAELHLDKRGDAAAAVPLLERAAILSIHATPIVLLLAPALVSIGRTEDAALLLRARVEAFGARRPKERALVHLALARALSAAREPSLALAELDVAVKIDPVNLRIRRALADAAADAGELESAQRTYRALLLVLPRAVSGAESAKPEITRAEVLLCLSAVSERLGDPADAAECEESALAAARESEWERSALERELLARGRHARLAELLSARVEGLDPEQAAAACDQLVRLYDDHLERTEDAFASALRAVSLTPASSARHAVALELGKRAGRPGAYLDLVREQSERARTPEAAYELFALLGAAEEAAEHLDDSARAFERAERAALELEPHEIGGRRLDHAWASLDRIYAKLGDAEARAPVLVRRLGASEARGEPAARRANGLYALAAIELASAETSARGVSTLEQALAAEPRLDLAEATLKQTLAREPGQERAARMYVALSRAEGRERGLIDALERLGAIEADRSSLREAASVALSIGDRSAAEALLRRFIELAEQRPEGAPRLSLLPPSAAERARVAEALLELARLRGQAGDVRENSALKEQAASRLSADRAKPILLEVAALAAGPLGDLPRAARIYSTLHRDAVGDRHVWEPLLEIHRARGDVEPLAALVEEIAPLLEDPRERARLRLEEATLLVRAAAVPSRRPSAPSEIDEEWGAAPATAARARPSIAPTRDTSIDVDRAVAALWLVLDDDPSSAEATELLGSLLERGNRREDLANFLARRINLELAREDGPAIASLATKLGSVLEEAGRDEDAQKAYRTAVQWDPENRAVHRALLRLSEKKQEPAELAKATETLLLLEVGAEAERLALRLVSLRDAQGDTKGMRRALEIGIERSPSSQALRHRLVEVFEDSAEWQDLAAYHIASAETRGTPEERVEALREAATVLRRELSDPSGAAKALERAFALAPHDRNLLLSLVNAWSSAGEPDRAALVVDRALEEAPDEVSLLHVRAVLREAADELDGALTDRERIHELTGGEHGVELAALLERMVTERRGEPTVEAGQRARLAEVMLVLGRVDDTIAQLEAVLRLDPSRRDVRAALAALYGDVGRVDDAIGAYALLLAIEQGEELVRDTLAFADLCVQANRLSALLPALERARSESPGDAEIKRRLHSTYAALGEKRTLAALLLEDAALASDAAVKFKLLADAARLLVDPTDGDPGRAIKVLADARALRPDDPEIGLLHADALTASGKAGEALDLLETLVATQKRRTKLRGAMHRRISQLYGGMGARMGSLQSLVKAMDDDPHDAALAIEVGLQAVELNDPDAAARAFRTITLMKTVVEGSTEGATTTTKATAYHQLARLADAQGDLRKARMLAEKAVSESPSHEEARAYRDALKKR